MSPVRAYIALGGNLGDRQAHLAFGRSRLAALPGTRVLGGSAIEETAPLNGLDQPDYLNQMVALDTDLAPRELLEACHRIEADAGRVRAERWASRTLDLDLVAYDDVAVVEPELTLPHPGLRDREFWQRELAELRRMGW